MSSPDAPGGPAVPADGRTVSALAEPAVCGRARNRVREGGGVPGPDAESTADFEHAAAARLNELSAVLLAGRYAPMPVRAVRIPKHQSTGGRELLLPAVEDRVVQRAFLDVVGERFEARFLPCSYAYRPGRSGDRAVAVVREAIRRRPPCRRRGHRRLPATPRATGPRGSGGGTPDGCPVRDPAL
jgi:hypothetical protein